MAVRSRRLWNVPLGAAVSTLFTVPAGRTLVLRTVTLSNPNIGNADVSLDLGPDISHRWLRRNLTNTDVLVVSEWWAFNPGDVLRGTATVAVGTVRCMGFGALLLGSPS